MTINPNRILLITILIIAIHHSSPAQQFLLEGDTIKAVNVNSSLLIGSPTVLPAQTYAGNNIHNRILWFSKHRSSLRVGKVSTLDRQWMPDQFAQYTIASGWNNFAYGGRYAIRGEDAKGQSLFGYGNRGFQETATGGGFQNAVKAYSGFALGAENLIVRNAYNFRVKGPLNYTVEGDMTLEVEEGDLVCIRVFDTRNRFYTNAHSYVRCIESDGSSTDILVDRHGLDFDLPAGTPGLIFAAEPYVNRLWYSGGLGYRNIVNKSEAIALGSYAFNQMPKSISQSNGYKLEQGDQMSYSTELLAVLIEPGEYRFRQPEETASLDLIAGATWHVVGSGVIKDGEIMGGFTFRVVVDYDGTNTTASRADIAYTGEENSQPEDWVFRVLAVQGKLVLSVLTDRAISGHLHLDIAQVKHGEGM